MANLKMKASELKILPIENKFYVFAGKDKLKTPNGHIIESASMAIPLRIKTDFLNQGTLVLKNGIVIKPRNLSAYVMESTRIDFMEIKDDALKDSLSWIENDPFFSTTASHPAVALYQKEQQKPAVSFLEDHGLQFKTWDQYEPSEREHILDLTSEIISNFSVHQISALINMFCPCGGHFFTTTMFIAKQITGEEWAKAVFSRTQYACSVDGVKIITDFLSSPNIPSNIDRESLSDDMIGRYKDECKIVENYGYPK